MQVWRSLWPKFAGRRTLLSAVRGRSRVHSGFLHAYRVNGFDARIKECIGGVLARLQPDCAGRPIKVYVTGHRWWRGAPGGAGVPRPLWPCVEATGGTAAERTDS